MQQIGLLVLGFVVGMWVGCFVGYNKGWRAGMSWAHARIFGG